VGATIPGPRHPVEIFRSGARFARSPHAALLQLHRDYGDVVAFGFGPSKAVALFGTAANEFVFTGPERFRWREAFDVLVPVDGDTALIVSDGPDHRRRRRVVAPAFHHRQVAGYVEQMVASVDTTIDTWRVGQAVVLYRERRSAVRRATVRILFGDRLAADAEMLGAQLQPVLDVVNSSPLHQLVQRRFGTPGWRRAMAAKRRVDERIYAEIAERRARPAPPGPGDVQNLLLTAADDGTALSDAEIRDQIVSLIAAGYETTSAALAWAGYALLTPGGAWDATRREVAVVVGKRAPVAADLDHLPHLAGVVAETLRLYPPATVSARTAATDLHYAGYDLPAGTLLLYSPYVTHRLPELWPEPERFRPERWDARLPGFRGPGPYEYLPFGGGAHRCLGAGFAVTELRAMLARLVQRTRLQLEPQRVRATSFTAMRPHPGLAVRVLETETGAGRT
jgi:cytochrome P450